LPIQLTEVASTIAFAVIVIATIAVGTTTAIAVGVTTVKGSHFFFVVPINRTLENSSGRYPTRRTFGIHPLCRISSIKDVQQNITTRNNGTMSSQ
jgi:hypothetical protein